MVGYGNVRKVWLRKNFTLIQLQTQCSINRCKLIDTNMKMLYTQNNACFVIMKLGTIIHIIKLFL